MLFSVRERTVARGGSVRLVGVRGQPQRLLRVTGAEPFLTGAALRPGDDRHQRAG